MPSVVRYHRQHVVVPEMARDVSPLVQGGVQTIHGVTQPMAGAIAIARREPRRLSMCGKVCSRANDDPDFPVCLPQVWADVCSVAADSDVCLQRAWTNNDYFCRNATQYCDDWNKDMHRCCPQS